MSSGRAFPVDVTIKPFSAQDFLSQFVFVTKIDFSGISNDVCVREFENDISRRIDWPRQDIDIPKLRLGAPGAEQAVLVAGWLFLVFFNFAFDFL